jgi:hypothetical protein
MINGGFILLLLFFVNFLEYFVSTESLEEISRILKSHEIVQHNRQKRLFQRKNPEIEDKRTFVFYWKNFVPSISFQRKCSASYFQPLKFVLFIDSFYLQLFKNWLIFYVEACDRKPEACAS